jgi:hypothetical protein
MFIALLFSPVYAKTFMGKNFSVGLPINPSLNISEQKGVLGSAKTWKYEGTYEKEKHIISYSIEHVIVKSEIFIQNSEERLAQILLRFFSQASGTMGETSWIAELTNKDTLGGAGYDMKHKAPHGVFYTRVIVTKPCVWVVNVVVINPDEESLEIAREILKTFKIAHPKQRV